jgi:hypothetical protein
MSMELIALIFLGVIVLGLLAIAGVFGLGLYLGWFSIGSGSAAGKDDFRFTMDADRIQNDKSRANDRARLGTPSEGQFRSAGRGGLGPRPGTLTAIPALDLSGTKFTDAGIDDLQKALPKAKIVR